MALVLADHVKETTTTTGTGTLTLTGAVAGFQTFAAVGNGNSTYYGIQSGTDWEIGVGTYSSTGPTLSRDTILSSSASGSAISVASGATVFVTYPAEKAIAAGTGYFTDQFAGNFIDGTVVDYSSGFGRIYVGGSDGIKFLTNGGADLLATANANGDWNLTGYLSIGSGTPISGATNPLFEINGAANNYVQAYIHNDASGASASADFICYPNNGTDTHGWIDIGACSSGYADATYTVTGPNELYLFASAPSGSSTTGNMVFATDSTGTANAFQWYIGGFTQSKSAYKLQLGSSGLDLKTTLLLNGSAGTSGYVLTSAGAGSIPTWQPAGGGGGSPGGSSGQVQYNSSGSFAGAANVNIDNGDLVLNLNNSPVTPGANTVKMFDRQIAGRNIPAFIGPSGLDSALQPLLGRNKVVWFSPILGAATLTGTNGLTITATGTATAATWASTTLATSTSRVNARATTAATTSVAGFRGGANQFWRGNATGLGGFTFVTRWSIGTSTATPTTTTLRSFCGLRSSTTAPTDVSPATLTNAVGVGWEAASTTLQIYCAGTAMTQIDTGITLNRTVESTIFEVAIFCPPNGSYINIQATDVGTGATYNTQVTTSTNLPSTTTALNPYMWTSAGGTSTQMGFNLHGIYVETDI